MNLHPFVNAVSALQFDNCFNPYVDRCEIHGQRLLRLLPSAQLPSSGACLTGLSPEYSSGTFFRSTLTKRMIHLPIASITPANAALARISYKHLFSC
jgi:hypothetical protein